MGAKQDADVCRQRGGTHAENGDNSDAITELSKAIVLYKRVAAHVDVTKAAAVIAQVCEAKCHLALARVRTAIANERAALAQEAAFIQAGNSHIYAAKSQNLAADIYARLDNHIGASNSRAAAAQSLSCAAAAYGSAGRKEFAKEKYMQASLGYSSAATHAERGKYSDETRVMRGFALAELLLYEGRATEAADMYNVSAAAFLSQGRRESAFILFSKAAELYTLSGRHPKASLIFDSMAKSCQARKEHGKAVELFTRAATSYV